MKKDIHLNNLNRYEITELASEALVILPIGATEQHGPHLPVCTDAIIAEEIAIRSCKEINKEDNFTAIVTPTLSFGNSHHHFPFSALSLTSETLNLVLKDLLHSLAITGFKNVIILNSHGGNDELIRIAARDCSREHQISVAAASYWTIAWEALKKDQVFNVGKVPGHAGGFETSIMMNLRPDLINYNNFPTVRNDEIPTEEMGRRLFIQRPKNSVGIDGYSDDASNANKDLGQKYLNTIVSEVTNAFQQFMNK